MICLVFLGTMKVIVIMNDPYKTSNNSNTHIHTFTQCVCVCVYVCVWLKLTLWLHKPDLIGHSDKIIHVLITQTENLHNDF